MCFGKPFNIHRARFTNVLHQCKLGFSIKKALFTKKAQRHDCIEGGSVGKEIFADDPVPYVF